jgi:prepilin-type N-terminal cleavage/methylation domain-containing protein
MAKHNKNIAESSGFSLVELSMVIIIIGLLIAGVNAGINLVNQAKLRSVIDDIQRYSIMYNAFLAKYNYPPGDFAGAYSMWGSNCASSSSLCDGNSDGVIGNTNEHHKAWKQLQLANILNANIVSPDGNDVTYVGINAPASKMKGAGYLFYGNLSPFTSVDNAIWIGGERAATSLIGNALLPFDAWSIDQKIDDGSVDNSGNSTGGITGIVRARNGVGGTCVDASGYYSVTSNSIACRLGMRVNVK